MADRRQPPGHIAHSFSLYLSGRVLALTTADIVSTPQASRAVATRAPTKTRIRLRDVTTYGAVVRAIAIRDLKARYKQSFLGPAWTLFQPLALLAAFSIGFNSIAHVQTGGVPYYLFALTGLAVWSYFQAVLMVATGAIVNNYPLVRWTACPRLALPLASLVTNLPSFMVPFLAACGAAAITGHLWLASLLLPVLMLWLFVLVACLAVTLSALTVRARDILSAMPFLLQILMFLSPVAYSTAHLSTALRTLVALNPLTGLIDAWRWSLLNVAPDLTAVVVALGVTTVAIAFSWRLFARIEVVIADEI